MSRNILRLCCVTAGAVIFLLSGCGTPQAGRDSGRDEARKRAEVHLQLAVGYFANGQLDTANAEIKRALQIDSGYVDAYNVQGLIQMAQSQNQRAEGSFQRALQMQPDNAEVLNNYGWFLCQTGREKDSLRYFEKAIQNRAQQSLSQALNNAGICSLRLKDVDAAERYLTQAFQQDPANAAINTNLADVYYRRGQLERAQFYINRALKSEMMAADTLWLAVRIERKLGDQMIADRHATQLRRRYPNSPEFAAYLRGAFDE